MTIPLREHYEGEHPGLSFELFPPKKEKDEESLRENVTELVRYGPSFMTCTYGAGGSTQDKTLDVVSWLLDSFDLPVASHLTCCNATREQLHAYMEQAADAGVSYVVALRGDPPQGETEFKAVEGGFAYANELVAYIKEHFPQFGVAVAGYPETHPEAASFASDLDNLKRKVDAGADVVITQLFFDNTDFYRFRDRCEQMGIETPIVPGILPVTNVKQIKRFASMCGAKLPPELLERLEAFIDDPAGQFDVGVYHATRQVEELMRNGAPGVHLYVLNRSRAAIQLMRALNLARPEPKASGPAS